MKLSKQEHDSLQSLKVDMKLVQLARGTTQKPNPAEEACVWLEKIITEAQKKK